MPQIIVIYGGKGGIAKTTTATNLAYLSGLDQTATLLVDANADQPSAQVIYRKLTAPPYDLAVEQQPEVLAGVTRAGYGRVIIDCPPSPAEAAAAIGAADLVVVPYVPRFLETQAITRTTRDTLAGYPFRVLFVAVTHAARNRAAQAREVFAGFGVPVFTAQIRAYAAHEKSQASGVSLFAPEAGDLDPNAAKAAGDYQAVYRELVATLAGGAR